MPKGTDKSFASNMYRLLTAHPRFSVPHADKASAQCFISSVGVCLQMTRQPSRDVQSTLGVVHIIVRIFPEMLQDMVFTVAAGNRDGWVIVLIVFFLFRSLGHETKARKCLVRYDRIMGTISF